jgi:hypothetical protein
MRTLTGALRDRFRVTHERAVSRPRLGRTSHTWDFGWILEAPAEADATAWTFTLAYPSADHVLAIRSFAS